MVCCGSGRRTGGVNRWNPLTWQFGHRAADPSNPDDLNNSNVMSFSEDRVRAGCGSVPSAAA